MNKPLHMHIVHGSHLDLYWMGEQAACLALGAKNIDAAVTRASADPSHHFFIETVRFLEYYLLRYPHRKQVLKQLIEAGNIEVGACYSDREENAHDGESLVRNAVYGNLKLMRQTLSTEQYAKYAALMNITLMNKGIELNK